MPNYNCTELSLSLNDTQKQAVRKLYATFAQRIADKKEVEPTLVAQLRQELSAVLDTHKDWKDHQVMAKASKHLMVHLLHTDNNLLSLPWHIVPFDNRFIHLSKGFGTEGYPFEIFKPEKVLPLKVLIVMSIPDDLEDNRLDYEGEIKKLIEAFEPILADAEVQIDFTNDGTLATMKEKLEQNAYHILHFSGHGEYNETTKEGSLLMEDDKTFKQRKVSAKEFVEVLSLMPENRPELIVLSACESAKGFDSMTEVLHAAGVPSIVSMSQRIEDYYATFFVAALYLNIVKHLNSFQPLSRSFVLAIEDLQKEEVLRKGKRAQYLIPQLFTSQHIRNLVDYKRPEAHALKFNVYKFVTGEKSMFLEHPKGYVFVGRRKQIREAMPILQQNKAVLLRGQGGVGKTALAQYLAHRLFLNDGKIYPFMLDEKKTNIEDLSTAMIAFLDKELHDYDVRRKVQSIEKAVEKFWFLLSRIRNQGFFPLFIFDNLEAFQVDISGHFQEKHHDLRDLINDIIEHGCYPVILTSRYPVLDLNDVTEINLNEVAFGDFYRKVQTLKFYELRYKLHTDKSIIERRLAQEGTDKADFKQIMSILFDTLGGNYRALEFFDNIYHTNSHSAYETLVKLDDFRQQFIHDSIKVREQLQNNAKSLVFDKLIALLSDDERRTLQLLEPFRVPVLPEAIDMVKNVGKVLNLADVNTHLQRLFDLTLIEQHKIDDDKVEAFYVAPLVRDFLQGAKLLALDFNHKRAGDYFGECVNITKNVFDAEEAYFHYYVAKDKREVNRYGGILCKHYYDKQFFDKAYNVGKQTEDFVGEEDTDGLTLSCLGAILQMYEKLDAALSYFERTLKQSYADPRNEASTLNNIGQIYGTKRDYDTALHYLKQSLNIRRQIGDRVGEGTTINSLAIITFAQGDYDSALEYWQQSLIIAQETNNDSGEGKTMSSISQIYSVKGDYDTALSYLKRSLDIQRSIYDYKGESVTLNNIGHIYVALSDNEKALYHLEKSLIIKQQIGDYKGESEVLNSIYGIYAAQKDYNTGLIYLKKSLQVLQKISNMAGIADNLAVIGSIYWTQQRDAKCAIPYFIQAHLTMVR
jgi:tetratricopeptide (TPR) repeat protein